MNAPSYGQYTFVNVKKSGCLYVPANSTGYDAWMQTSQYNLGFYSWSKSVK